jgi:hypothetical protein
VSRSSKRKRWSGGEEEDVPGEVVERIVEETEVSKEAEMREEVQQSATT